VLDLPVGHRGQPGKHVAQIGMGIDAAAAATLDNGVEDGAAFAGIGIAEEEPVLFSERRRSNRVLDQIIINLKSAIFEIDAKQGPVGERVIDGLAKSAVGQAFCSVPFTSLLRKQDSCLSIST